MAWLEKVEVAVVLLKSDGGKEEYQVDFFGLKGQ